MDVTDIMPQVNRLDGEVDDLEEALTPLLSNVAEMASRLPLLDKAKLYVLVTYSIESMLFSALRLNEVDAKEHPVFKELTRVRQYFEKIKTAEAPPPSKPEQSVNKEAAIRFIRADLADNKEVNTKLTEMIAKERALAAVKASAATKRTVEASNETASSNPSEVSDAGPPSKKSKKERKAKKEKKAKKASK